MSYSLYILYSKVLNRFYIGQTQDLNERILLHQEKQFKDAYTSKSNDWELFYSIPCASRTQVMQIENHIKRMKSRTYIENLRKYPEISDKLRKQYP